jgi:hypothetical protein
MIKVLAAAVLFSTGAGGAYSSEIDSAASVTSKREHPLAKTTAAVPEPPEPKQTTPPDLKPKVEPREEGDVTDLRFEKEPGDGTYVFAACKITNRSDEMSDYLIEVEAVYPDPSFAAKTATIRAAHVRPGATLDCPRGSFLADFNPNEWKLTTIRIDRISTKHRNDYPDEQLSSEYLGLNHGEDGIRVDYSLTNNAERKSEYVVTYDILDANLVGVHRGSYKTKGLEYLENQTGSIPVPDDVVRKLRTSLDYGERLEDLKEVRLLDVDRTIYE